MSVNVHLYPTTMTQESRMMRVTSVLVQTGVFTEVLVVGVAGGTLPAEERIDDRRRILRVPRPFPVPRGLRQRLINGRHWASAVEEVLRDVAISCVNCHSLAALPLCARLAARHRVPLVYEPHELETETIGSRGIRRVLARLAERRYIRRAGMVITVGRAIADWYERTYGLKDVAVFRNIPAPPERRSTTMPLRKELGIPTDALVAMYLGGLFRHRRIDQYLRVFASLPPSHHLVFMGTGELEPMVRAAARDHHNVHFVPPVPSADVLPIVAQADLGLCGVEPACLSYELCLPNKLFEYIHAGIGVLSAELPEVRAILEAYGCGVVPADGSDQSLRSALTALTRADVERLRTASAAASRRLTYEAEAATLRARYDAFFAMTGPGAPLASRGSDFER